jgi:gluconate 2-dehydrogenase gamma chain
MRTADEPPPALLFLNRAEADAVDAMAARIVPGDAGDPGAREAGAMVYIDRTLAGFARGLQTFYRRGLRGLDELARDGWGRRFAELDAAEQDRVLAELDRRALADPSDDLGRLFAVVREHVVQGLFCDPAYGGNRDGAGWKLVGFPGARWGYGAAQMERGFDARTIPITTLADLYAGDRSES